MSKFSEFLNENIKRAGCSAQELAQVSGLSSSVLSRWRSGERKPKTDGDSLRLLAAGLSKILLKNGQAVNEDELLGKFRHSLETEEFPFDRIVANLNVLIERLELSPTEIARRLNYDPSHFYRIRMGEHRPSHPGVFVNGVCQFVLRKYPNTWDRSALASLLGCDPEKITENGACYQRMQEWLVGGETETVNPIGDFLAKLDSFDLNEYIRSIHFDELKIPTVPFQFPGSKTYYGVEQMKTGELDFLKITAIARSRESVFMCSDMPMEDMAKDLDFGKKWMFGLAAMLKKGLHINVIHNIDRPFAEMMLGMESWIPLYMTGQVSPFYFNAPHNSVYCHFNNVSGAAALAGECVAGQHDHGKYYLTKNHEEIKYYRQRADDLLKKAHPLMLIFKADAKAKLEPFLSSDADKSGSRHNILSSPPIHTISDDLLERILKRKQITPELQARIKDFVALERKRIDKILVENPVRDEVGRFSAEEFSRYPVTLSLSVGFIEEDIPYTYEEYSEHLEQTVAYTKIRKNYTVEFTRHQAFRNIQIYIHEGEWAMVSKSNAPIVNFVIRHPKLRSAIENMAVAVVD